MFAFGLLLAAQAAPTQATATTPPPNPQDPSVLLVEALGPARYGGTPQSCVEPDADGEIPICMMELYEADVRVLRRFDGPDIGRRAVIRFTTHSFNVVWQRGVRFILNTQPFEDQGRSGHFASYWDWEDAAGQFCESPEALARMNNSPLANVYLRGRLRTITRATDEYNVGTIHCANGRERAR